MENPYCDKHQEASNGERWKASFSELVSGEDEHIEPFRDAVCPICYLALRDKNRKNRRQLRAESQRALRLQAEVGRLQRVVEETVEAVKEATGKDAFAMVGQIFPRPGQRRGSPVHGPIDQAEVGKLERILPNLIMEAIKGNGKTQNVPPSEQ